MQNELSEQLVSLLEFSPVNYTLRSCGLTFTEIIVYTDCLHRLQPWKPTLKVLFVKFRLKCAKKWFKNLSLESSTAKVVVGNVTTNESLKCSCRYAIFFALLKIEKPNGQKSIHLNGSFLIWPFGSPQKKLLIFHIDGDDNCFWKACDYLIWFFLLSVISCFPFYYALEKTCAWFG